MGTEGERTADRGPLPGRICAWKGDDGPAGEGVRGCVADEGELELV